MSMPEFNEYGYIPKGTWAIAHDALNAEVSKMNDNRREIWTRFIKFQVLFNSLNLFSEVYYFGSFFSTKNAPSDVDLALRFKEIEKPTLAHSWLFDKEHLKREFQAHVVFIEPKDINFKDALPIGLNYATPDLKLSRTLSPEQQKEWAHKLKQLPQELHGLEFKGVLRVMLV